MSEFLLSPAFQPSVFVLELSRARTMILMMTLSSSDNSMMAAHSVYLCPENRRCFR